MDVTFTLTINGDPAVTLESLALSFLSLELTNMQVDSASLAWVRDSAAEICPLADLDEVEIFCNGVRLFVGRVKLGQIRREGCSVSVRGPWSHLDEFIVNENLIGGPQILRVGDVVTTDVGEDIEFWNGTEWVQVSGPIIWTVGYTTFFDPDHPADATLNTNHMNTSRWMLWWEYFMKSVQQQFQKLLDYMDHIADVPMYTVGAIDWGDDLYCRKRTVQDMSVAEAMRQSLAPHPDAAIWWEYSGSGLPVLRGGRASAEMPMVLTVDEPPMTEYDLAPMDDLKVAGVVLRWETDGVLDGRGRPTFVYPHPLETPAYGRRVMVQSLTGQSQGFMAGLAPALYESLNVDRVRGSLTVLDPDFSLGLRPGMTVELEGDAMLAGYQLWVQGVRWNPATGLATLTVGYPRHLNLEELADLRQYFRQVAYLPGQPPADLTVFGEGI